MEEQLRLAALEYHRLPTAGKISIAPTKSLINQRDLALAYSPGVAAACDAIFADPAEARSLTSRGNLVAVVTNGTAVLGLGNIGPLAGKPVMEGKACLFKKFSGIDVFDIELAETDPDEMVKTIARLEPTFGGINLEDIKAPDCFYIERKLRERMKIPVFHDDQHGTAIVAGAAILNGLKVVGKDVGAVKLVCSGAGAAAIACLDLMVGVGLKRENIVVCDSKGVIYAGRETPMEENKARYARDTKARTLADAIVGADIFLGLSGPKALSQEMVKTMAKKPLILALANPEPEIRPELVREVRPDAIIATGRSDYPNQVNNVLCFPFIFRGALDVGATSITDAMKLACMRAIAELAHAEQSDIVAQAYAGEALSFGPEYLIPKPFDPRLMVTVPPAVAKAAMESGVATRPIADFDAYQDRLTQFVYHSGLIMKPVFAGAKGKAKRVVYAEGEEERVLRAVQVVIDEQLARPMLIGRPEVITARIAKFGLRLTPGKDFDLININSDPRYRECWQTYYQLMGRDGVSPEDAKEAVLRKPSLIGTLLLRMGECDALVCGTVGKYHAHLRHVEDVIGLREGAPVFAAMNGLLLPNRTLFICDTYVNRNPSPTELAGITRLAAATVRRFGLVPRVALLSHSNFGSDDSESARKMREARRLIVEREPGLEIDGEMHGDAALSEEIRNRVLPDSTLKGEANLLVMPNVDAANIAFNLLKVTGGEGLTIGPILLGANKAVLIATPSATVRRLVNLTALAVVDAAAGGG
jgi:malate dehydrogenase (oxaloacetate-decarboxylating)(NADP+)